MTKGIKALTSARPLREEPTFNDVFVCPVSPDKYWTNFQVDSSSGVVSVLTALDREEMDSSVISVSIKVPTLGFPLDKRTSETSIVASFDTSKTSSGTNT